MAECQCNTCKYSRKEISFNELIILETKVFENYLKRLNNLENGAGNTFRDEEGNWCKADIIKYSADEIMMYINCSAEKEIYNKELMKYTTEIYKIICDKYKNRRKQ